jgi:hypothetical protein
MKKRLLRLLAWAVTAGLLILLFKRIPFHEVVAAARGAAGWTVPAAFFFGLAIYLGDSFAIWKTFGWFLLPPPTPGGAAAPSAQLSFTDVLLVRGATYLLAAINYNVGQGAIVYFVHRVARVPVVRGVATVLLIMGINVLALLFLATFGLAVAPAVPHALKLIVAVAYAGLAVYVAAVLAKPRWLASRPLFDVLLGAGLGGHARALAVRLPHIAILFAFQIVMLRGFGVAVPIIQAIAALPVVFFIAVLPISVQGLGTTQAAMIYFFARYAPGDSHAQQAAVLAASLVGQVCTLSFQAVLGVACLKSRVGRALAAASAEAQAAPVPATPS